MTRVDGAIGSAWVARLGFDRALEESPPVLVGVVVGRDVDASSEGRLDVVDSAVVLLFDGPSSGVGSELVAAVDEAAILVRFLDQIDEEVARLATKEELARSTVILDVKLLVHAAVPIRDGKLVGVMSMLDDVEALVGAAL